MERRSDWPGFADDRQGITGADSGHGFGNLGSGLSQSLPRPQPGKAGRGGILLFAFLAVLALGCASFWLTRAPAERSQLRKEAIGKVNELLAETPLATVAENLAKADAPELPESVVNPPTAAGTLAGRQVIGTIAAPLDFGPILPRAIQPPENEEKTLREVIHEAADDLAQFVGVQEKEPVVFSQDYVPQATEDSTVPPGYLNSLAAWLARHYKPGPQGLAINVQSLNQECGARLTSQVPGGRQNLLRYAFQAEMIAGLYRLYIERFLADLQAAAADRGLDDAGTQGFYAALAGKAALYANALEGVLQIQNLPERLKQIDAAGDKVVDANLALTTTVFELDELRGSGAGKQQLAAAQLKVNEATARYRQATADYAQAQTRLAAEIRKSAGPGLDDDSLLFMAAWAGRREQSFGNARAALNSCATVLRDFASRCHALESMP